MSRTDASQPELLNVPVEGAGGGAQRRKILSDTLLLNAASVAAQVLSVVQSFLVMRLLGPEAMGVWLGAMVVLGYATYAHLGLDYGLGLRLPYFVGQADRKRLSTFQDTAYAGWTALGLLAAIGIGGFALLAPLSRESRWALLAVAAIVPFDQQVAFFTRWRASAQLDFSLASYLAMAKGLISLLLVVPLTAAFHLPGFIAGMVVVAVLVFAMWRTQAAFHWSRAFESAALVDMMRVGVPVLVVSLAGILIQTVDRLLILGTLGTASLGYYGVTSLGGGMLYGVLAQAGNAVAPHLSTEFGRSGSDPRSLERFLLKPTLLLAHAAAVGILALAIVIPALVQVALPRFTPGLPAFYAYVPGFYFLGLILTANNILNIILIEQRRQRLVIYIQGAAILIQAGLGWLLLRAGFGLPGVALASTVSYAFYGLIILTMAAQQSVGDPARRWSFLLHALVPLLAAIAVGAVAYQVGGLIAAATLAGIIARAVVQLGVGMVLLIPTLVLFAHRGGLGRELGNLRNLAHPQAIRRVFGAASDA